MKFLIANDQALMNIHVYVRDALWGRNNKSKVQENHGLDVKYVLHLFYYKFYCIFQPQKARTQLVWIYWTREWHANDQQAVCSRA